MIEVLIVSAIVLAAGAYLVRRAYRKYGRKSDNSCGGCGTCPASSPQERGSGISAERK